MALTKANEKMLKKLNVESDDNPTEEDVEELFEECQKKVVKQFTKHKGKVYRVSLRITVTEEIK